jgi:hypothetical protein
MSLNRTPQDGVVSFQGLREARPELLDETSRPFDIGEEEGDGSDWQ